VNQNSFELAFILGNISVCKGCRQRYKKPAVPPMDLCIRHKEWQDFVDPVGKVQHKFGNVYYHANAPCVQALLDTFVWKSVLKSHDIFLKCIKML